MSLMKPSDIADGRPPDSSVLIIPKNVLDPIASSHNVTSVAGEVGVTRALTVLAIDPNSSTRPICNKTPSTYRFGYCYPHKERDDHGVSRQFLVSKKTSVLGKGKKRLLPPALDSVVIRL
jgi:hypothetical protein